MAKFTPLGNFILNENNYYFDCREIFNNSGSDYFILMYHIQLRNEPIYIFCPNAGNIYLF